MPRQSSSYIQYVYAQAYRHRLFCAADITCSSICVYKYKVIYIIKPRRVMYKNDLSLKFSVCVCVCMLFFLLLHFRLRLLLMFFLLLFSFCFFFWFLLLGFFPRLCVWLGLFFFYCTLIIWSQTYVQIKVDCWRAKRSVRARLPFTRRAQRTIALLLPSCLPACFSVCLYSIGMAIGMVYGYAVCCMPCAECTIHV